MSFVLFASLIKQKKKILMVNGPVGSLRQFGPVGSLGHLSSEDGDADDDDKEQ